MTEERQDDDYSKDLRRTITYLRIRAEDHEEVADYYDEKWGDAVVKRSKSKDALERKWREATDKHVLFETLALACEAITDLREAMLKLPARSEFDAVREELEKHQNSVKNALIPLKQAIEASTARSDRGDEIYG